MRRSVLWLLAALPSLQLWPTAAWVRLAPSTAVSPQLILRSLMPMASGDNPFRLVVSPLIGGPSWLPLHVKVSVAFSVPTRKTLLQDPTLDSNDQSQALRNELVLDFVPRDATNPQTLVNLIQLRSVPAEIRMRLESQTAGMGESGFLLDEQLVGITHATESSTGSNMSAALLEVSDEYVSRALAFCRCQQQRFSELHLIRNNCWSFALTLLQELAYERPDETAS